MSEIDAFSTTVRSLSLKAIIPLSECRYWRTASEVMSQNSLKMRGTLSEMDFHIWCNLKLWKNSFQRLNLIFLELSRSWRTFKSKRRRFWNSMNCPWQCMSNILAKANFMLNSHGILALVVEEPAPTPAEPEPSTFQHLLVQQFVEKDEHLMPVRKLNYNLPLSSNGYTVSWCHESWVMKPFILLWECWDHPATLLLLILDPHILSWKLGFQNVDKQFW